MPEANGPRRRIVEFARESIANNALIVDTETTGLGEDAEIVEIGIIDALETFEFSALVRPSEPIPAEASAIHGITNHMVACALPASKLWPIVRQMIVGRPLLAYNSEFDIRMMCQTFDGFATESNPWSCLMNDWMYFHGLERWQRLDNVCYQIGIQPGGHRALGDANAAREVLRWLAKQEI